ncbi:MAG: GntR family transcriptional regulator [Alphaproteobacteria bacterium]|jgi:DNA-binding GntR family transcriptional regulator
MPTSPPDPARPAEVPPRQSLADQVKAYLIGQIMSGALAPGDRVVELRIAEAMQTSQAPVREAIRELEATGIVETQRNRGTRVRVVTDNELREIYAVRAELEGFAAELAVAAGPALAARLEHILDDMRKAGRRDDLLGFADCNAAFHRTIVEAADNSVLRDLWERLNIQFRTIVNVGRSARDLMPLVDSHLPIVAALAAGDAARARRAAHDHILENRPDRAVSP